MIKKRFAVIGCGNIGSRHIAIAASEPLVKLVAICDIDKNKCVEYSSKYDDIPWYLDYLELLEKEKIDVVSICTPHGLHCEMAIEAAKRGINILVEKPMALSSLDAQRMIDCADDNDVQLIVVRQNRYNIPIAITHQAIAEGKIGKIFMVQCNVLWNRHQGYYEDSDWRGSKDLEGGALFTQVSHFIDLLIWWFGDVADAYGVIDTKNHAIEIEDCGNAILTFDSGVIGNLTWTTCVYNKNYEGSIIVIGENGIIKIGGEYLNKIEFWDVASYPLPNNVSFTDKPNKYGKYQGTSSNHDKVLKDVARALLNERNDCVDGNEGIRTIKAIEKIYGNTVIRGFNNE